MTCIFTWNVTLPRVLFTRFVSKNHPPGFSVSGTLAWNGLNEILMKHLGNRFQGAQAHVYEYEGETLNTVEGATTRTTGLRLAANIYISAMSECKFMMQVSFEEIFYHFLIMNLRLPCTVQKWKFSIKDFFSKCEVTRLA